MTDTRKQKSLIDDIAEGIRRILDDIDSVFNPKKKQRVPVPVPVRREPDSNDPRNYR